MSEKKPRVLVVDDEPDICELLCFELEERGFETETAHSVDEGLQKFSEQPTDIIISDVRMPQKSGVELLREVVKRDHAPLFVFMTGFADVGLRDIYQLGACGLFAKPLDQDELMSFLERSLATRTNPQEFGKRDSSRVNSKIPARIGNTPQDQGQAALIKNMSRTGAYFTLPSGELPKIGDVVEFVFQDTQAGSEPVKGKGICKWVSDDDGPQKGFGLRFEEISPSSFAAFFVQITRLGSLPRPKEKNDSD